MVLVRGELENLLRELTPSVLGVLVRRHGDFAACEDAVQEALLAAATRWPVSGLPENTDWAQILALYDHLTVLAPGPMVTLNRIVAVAMVHGPRLALHQLDDAQAAAPALAGHHRLHAVRAHLLDLAGDTGAARELYRTAARMTLSVPERRYLESRAQAGVSGNAIM